MEVTWKGGSGEATLIYKNIVNKVERDGISSVQENTFGTLMVKINKLDSSNVI